MAAEASGRTLCALESIKNSLDIILSFSRSVIIKKLDRNFKELRWGEEEEYSDRVTQAKKINQYQSH